MNSKLKGVFPPVEIYVDGSATFGGSPNPKRGMKGDTYCSYVVTLNGVILEEECIPLGKGTINQAEYAAVIYALSRAKELGCQEVSVFSDSSVIVMIVNKREDIKSSKIVGANEWTEKLHPFIDKHFKRCKVEWIPRRENKLAHGVIARYQKESIVTGLIDLAETS